MSFWRVWSSQSHEAKYPSALDARNIFYPAPSENATSRLDSLKMCYTYFTKFDLNFQSMFFLQYISKFFQTQCLKSIIWYSDDFLSQKYRLFVLFIKNIYECPKIHSLPNSFIFPKCTSTKPIERLPLPATKTRCKTKIAMELCSLTNRFESPWRTVKKEKKFKRTKKSIV